MISNEHLIDEFRTSEGLACPSYKLLHQQSRALGKSYNPMITQLDTFWTLCNSLFKMKLLRAKLGHFQSILHFPFRVPPALAMRCLCICLFQTGANHFLQFGLHLLWGGSKGEGGLNHLNFAARTAGLIEIGILEHRHQAGPLFQALKHLLGVFP